jgi:hypothetical protein
MQQMHNSQWLGRLGWSFRPFWSLVSKDTGDHKMPMIGTIGPMTGQDCSGKQMQDDLVVEILCSVIALGAVANDTNETIARAALATIEAAGYVVVPREPTEAMIKAEYDWDDGPYGIWQAMVAAALDQPLGKLPE